MMGLGILLAIVIGLCLLLSPIAFFLVMGLRNRLEQLEAKLSAHAKHPSTPAAIKQPAESAPLPIPSPTTTPPPDAPTQTAPQTPITIPTPVSHPAPAISPRPTPVTTPPAAPIPAPAKPSPAPLPTKIPASPSITDRVSRTKTNLEQQIGTRWVLIAGVITTLIGACFFLKYAYDNNLIGPLGRVIIAAAAGLTALTIGEYTRRRNYGVVARGLTALGFAILYAAIFSAYSLYKLLPTEPAFAISILITAAAMLYAVTLNDMLPAVLALLGGFLAPVLLSTGENRPFALFSYTAMLSLGAMLCAAFRKWRMVNLLAFIGTMILYAGWYNKFYRPALPTLPGELPYQLPIAIIALSVFFGLFLVLPIFYELVRKTLAQKEDVTLIVGNAMATFAYLWQILYDRYRPALALAVMIMCAAHLLLMQAVRMRCERDLPVRLSLLALSIFFLTIAVPLYLKMYAVPMAWAAEAAILTLISLKYRSIWTRCGAVAAMILSIIWLCRFLPMHSAPFTIIRNPAFGSWCFTAASLVICHLLYRYTHSLDDREQQSWLSQAFYTATILLLFAAVSLEWFAHTQYNLLAPNEHNVAYPDRYYPPLQYIRFAKGLVIFIAAAIMLLAVRPLTPKGLLPPVFACAAALAGSCFVLIEMNRFYLGRFDIFVNPAFLIFLTLVAAVFAAAWRLRRRADELPQYTQFSLALTFWAVFLLWGLLTEQIYLYWHNRADATIDLSRCAFLGQMYISVMWAVYAAVLMTIGFLRRWAALRYIALGLFALVLGKVFIFDTSQLKNVYRIAGFIVLGVILVAISYGYQFAKKKNLFGDRTP